MADLIYRNGGAGFGQKPKTTPADTKASDALKIPTAAEWAAQNGPMGYSDAMLANLGLNIPQGGPSPTSGMAAIAPNAGTPYWYDPVAAQPNPLEALLGILPLPTTPQPVPTTPTTTPTTPTPGRNGPRPEHHGPRGQSGPQPKRGGIL